MKRWITIITGLVLVGILTVFLFPIIRDSLIHNLRLSRMKRLLDEISHPDNTEYIFSRSVLGLLAGNGNHCDYFVGEMRSFKGWILFHNNLFT